jgi:hypothetical protein
MSDDNNYWKKALYEVIHMAKGKNHVSVGDDLTTEFYNSANRKFSR